MPAESLLSAPPAPTIAPLLLTQRQAAEACALCEKSLYLAVRRGELRAVKIGRAVRYDPRDLTAWIDSMKAQTEGESNPRNSNAGTPGRETM